MTPKEIDLHRERDHMQSVLQRHMVVLSKLVSSARNSEVWKESILDPIDLAITQTARDLAPAGANSVLSTVTRTAVALESWW